VDKYGETERWGEGREEIVAYFNVLSWMDSKRFPPEC